MKAAHLTEPASSKPRASFRQALRRLREISWHARWLLVEAGAWLVLSRVAVFLLPFRWIARSWSSTTPVSAIPPLPWTAMRPE